MSIYTTHYVKRSDAERMLNEKGKRVYSDENIENLGNLLDIVTPHSCENYLVVEDNVDLSEKWFTRSCW